MSHPDWEFDAAFEQLHPGQYRYRYFSLRRAGWGIDLLFTRSGTVYLVDPWGVLRLEPEDAEFLLQLSGEEVEECLQSRGLFQGAS